MGSSGASKIPIRETIDDEVLPLVVVDQALVAVKDTWDLDSAINVSSQASRVDFKMLIHADIDLKGDYAVRTDFRPAQPPPTATPTTPVDVPEPVAILIVLGHMKTHHERSLEEPPAHFLEGEDVDNAESDEDQAHFLEGEDVDDAESDEDQAHFLEGEDVDDAESDEDQAHFLEGEDVDDAKSDEDQAGGSTPEPPKKRARMVTAGKLATLGLADEGLSFGSVLEPHVPAGPAKQ